MVRYATTAAGNQAHLAEAACLARLPTSAGIERAEETTSGPARHWPTPDISSGGWHTTLTDTRGPCTVMLFEAGGGRARSLRFGAWTPTGPAR